MMRRRRVVDNVIFALLFAAAAAVLFLTTTTTVVVHAQEAQGEDAPPAAAQQYACQFSAPLELAAGVRLESVKNVQAGTFTMRLTYTKGLGWVSIGVNTEGGDKMVPGTAIIGRIEYDDDEITPLGSSVLKYDLVTDAEDGSGVVVMADDMQTLTDASFVQFAESEVSVLTFTQRLDDVGYESIGGISDETSWMFAIGLPDNQWQGKHEVHGSFFLVLEDNCVKMSINTGSDGESPEVITDVEQEPPPTDTTTTEGEDEDEPAPGDEIPHDADPDETSVGVPEPELEQQPTDDEDDADNVDADTDADADTDVDTEADADTGDGGDNVTADAPAPGDVVPAPPAPAPGDVVPAPAPAPAPATSYECAYVEPREIWIDKVKLEHYKNTAAGTYTMRITYLKGEAWVSIGVNHEGKAFMAPSTCIIGRIEFDEDGITPIGSSVLKYDVTTTKADASGVIAMADEFQTLTDATFEQDGETSILTFTQKLDDSGMIGPITDESSWIFAVGLPDNQWEGNHKVHGHFLMPLEDNCVLAGADAVESDNEGGIVMRESAAETTFPYWAAHGWLMAIAWGLFGPLAIGAAMLRRLVGSNWYKIHFYLNMMCVVLTIVGFSLAVVATNMEQKPHFPRRTSQGDHETVHHNAGLAIFIIVILQSVAGYFRPPATPAPVAAPAAKLLDDGENENKQKPIFRHADTRTTDTDEGTTLHSIHIHGSVSYENEVVLQSTPESLEPPQQSPSKDTSEDLEGSQETTPSAVASDQQKSKSPWVRKTWEIFHRLTGAVVVGLAWYNCHTGYVLMESNYDETQDFTAAFWSVTGAIVGAVFILAYAARM